MAKTKKEKQTEPGPFEIYDVWSASFIKVPEDLYAKIQLLMARFKPPIYVNFSPNDDEDSIKSNTQSVISENPTYMITAKDKQCFIDVFTYFKQEQFHDPVKKRPTPMLIHPRIPRED